MAKAKLEVMREQALALTLGCSDPQKLERMIVNARRQGDEVVERAPMRKLYEVKPEAEPGTLEHDVWRSIFALEGALTSEREQTTRLGRTRQQIAKRDETATLTHLVKKKNASEGFHMLVKRGWPELTFEAVALRHPDRFEEEVREAATKRLLAAGFSVPGI